MLESCFFYLFSGMPFVSEDPDQDTFKVKIYLKTTTKVKKTVPDYPVLTMIAEIGGYTGLLLGISIVNLTSLIDKMFEKVGRN